MPIGGCLRNVPLFLRDDKESLLQTQSFEASIFAYNRIVERVYGTSKFFIYPVPPPA